MIDGGNGGLFVGKTGNRLKGTFGESVDLLWLKARV